METAKLISNLNELIQNIEKVESYLNADAHEEEFMEMREYIKRGHNFVAYTVDEKIHFAPSRFVGYKNNNLFKHHKYKLKNQVSGTHTDNRISSSLILNMQKISSKTLDEQYISYCKKLGIEVENRKRKYWQLKENINVATDNDLPSTYREGAEKLIIHTHKERNHKVVQAAKRRFIKLHGKLYCEICGFNFEDVYGDIGTDFIEAHHIRPIAESDGEYDIKPEDFIMVCPNCHSMLHRNFQGETVTIEELKEITKKSFNFSTVTKG